MTVVSLLNSGADVQTEDEVCTHTILWSPILICIPQVANSSISANGCHNCRVIVKFYVWNFLFSY